MSTNRRRFLESAAANVAALAVMPAAAYAAVPHDIAMFGQSSSDDWDLSWTDRLKRAKHTAVFDCTDTESGLGVWRASAWTRQNIDVLKAASSDVIPVIVLRHNAIILAMQQSFWDKYGIGAARKITHPVTQQPTTKNPVLLDEKDGLAAPFNTAALHKQLARGAIALACNMAFEDCIDTIARHDKVSADEARKRAIAYLVPGVILQPSGVFAATTAQEGGATYVKAS